MDLSNKEDRELYWNKEAAAALVGRGIVKARYMTPKEAENFGWTSRPVVLILDNGAYVIVQSDDEGNDGGAVLILDDPITFEKLREEGNWLDVVNRHLISLGYALPRWHDALRLAEDRHGDARRALGKFKARMRARGARPEDA